MKTKLTLLLTFMLYALGIAAQENGPNWGYVANESHSAHVVYVGVVDSKGKPVDLNLDTYLGAFIDGKCRGQVKLARSNDIYYFPIRIEGTASDNGKAISFRIREPWGTEYELKGPQTINYQNETTTGSLSSLFKLNFEAPLFYDLTQDHISVKVGESLDLTPYIKFTPENANMPIINWDFANSKSYFEVVNNKLRGKAPVMGGYLGLIINNIKYNGNGQGCFFVNVIQTATSITLKDEYEDGINVNVGDVTALTKALNNCYTVLPENYNEELKWTSSDPTAIVSTMEADPNGIMEEKFNPKKPGTYTMTLKGEKASIDLKVNVYQKVTGIKQTFSEFISINVGESLKDIIPLTYKIMPEDATDKSVTCKIDNGNNNKSVLEERNGEIVGVNPGVAYIHVKSKDDPNLSEVFLVVCVRPEVKTLTFKKNELSIVKPESDGDKADYFEEVKANIVFSPNWPVWPGDKETEFSINSDNQEVLDLNYNFYEPNERALPVQLGTANVNVKYSAPHTIIQNGVLQNIMTPLSGSFKVNVVQGLQRFTIENVRTGLGKPVEVKLIPEPADVEIDASLIKVTVEWNPDYSDKPGDTWEIATIASASEDNLTWTLNPLALGHGTIYVSYGNKENMGEGEFTIGQSYIQKEGWKWSTFLNTLESGTMQDAFGDAVQEIRSADQLMYNDPQYGYFGILICSTQKSATR